MPPVSGRSRGGRMRFASMVAMGMRTTANVAFGLRRPINVMLASPTAATPSAATARFPSGIPRTSPPSGCCGSSTSFGLPGSSVSASGRRAAVRKDIGTLVSHAHRHGIYVTMDSNGFLWPERQAELADLDHLMISLDGDAAGHEANRGPGSFNRTMRALEMAAARPGSRCGSWRCSPPQPGGHRFSARHRPAAQDSRRLPGAAPQRHPGAQSRPDDGDHRGVPRGHPPAAEAQEGRRSHRLLVPVPEVSAGLAGLSAALLGRAAAGAALQGGRALLQRGRRRAGVRLQPAGGRVPAENALEVGFEKAFRSIPPLPCQGCMAACYTEYNYLYRLDPICIAEWIRRHGPEPGVSREGRAERLAGAHRPLSLLRPGGRRAHVAAGHPAHHRAACHPILSGKTHSGSTGGRGRR